MILVVHPELVRVRPFKLRDQVYYKYRRKGELVDLKIHELQAMDSIEFEYTSSMTSADIKKVETRWKSKFS